jgi:biopolymer transport protein ExbD
MADVLQHEHKQKAGVHRSKKASLRVDLTPMVDLGFLLISFFVFTTTISQPKAMKLAMPDNNTKDSSLITDVKTLNLVLGANNKVYAYNGLDIKDISDLGNDSKAMRAPIIQKKNEVRNKYGNNDEMVVLIKATDRSTYANVVNALDEMLICNVKTYVLADADINELNAIK